MSLIYFAPSDLQIPRVDRNCIVHYCAAAGSLGWEVDLICLGIRLDYDEPTKDRDLHDVYGVPRTFHVTTVPSRGRQAREQGHGSAAWRTVAYPVAAAWRLLRNRRLRAGGPVALYCKNYALALALLPLRRLLGRRGLLVLEIHLPPQGRLQRKALNWVDGVIAISSTLAEKVAPQVRNPGRRLLAAHQGVDLDRISRLTMASAREALGLPQDRKLVVYTGKVHVEYKEIHYLLEIAPALVGSADIVIVGGREDHVAALRRQVESDGIHNVRFIGFVPPSAVSSYQAAADVLVSYYPSGINLNAYRSPGKLFEYLAAGRPIVMADYPFAREVLGPAGALFVEPDRPDLLRDAVTRLLDDSALGKALASRARSLAPRYTWKARAESIERFTSRLATL